jgi:hypothetical protein
MSDRGDLTERLTLPRWRARWIGLSPLGRDIAVILVVKFAALALLWWVFFSHPAARHMSVEVPRVEAHLVPSASPEEPSRAVR